MQDTRVPLPRDLPLEDPVDDEVLQAPWELIPAPLPALAREEEPEAVIHLPAEDSEDHGQEGRHGVGVERRNRHASEDKAGRLFKAAYLVILVRPEGNPFRLLRVARRSVHS